MAKGDYVRVMQEIGGQLVEARIDATGDGQRVYMEQDKRTGDTVVELQNRKGKKVIGYRFAAASVRQVEEKLREE